MPKVSAKHVQRRIADLDAQYTVAQTKRSGWRMVALIILAIITVAAFAVANRSSSDFVQLTLKTWSCACHVGSSLNRIQKRRVTGQSFFAEATQ